MHWFWQIAVYGSCWWLFAALVFLVARFAPWYVVPIAFLAVAFSIYMLDVRWVQAEMRKPGWDGSPDMDLIFMFGVMERVVLASLVLMPVAVLGRWLGRRSRAGRTKGRWEGNRQAR